MKLGLFDAKVPAVLAQRSSTGKKGRKKAKRWLARAERRNEREIIEGELTRMEDEKEEDRREEEREQKLWKEDDESYLKMILEDMEDDPLDKMFEMEEPPDEYQSDFWP